LFFESGERGDVQPIGVTNMPQVDIHVGYYVREIRDGVRYLSVGQGPLVKVMPLAHVGACFAVFANLKAPFEEEPSVVSTVVRDARTQELLESFARPVDINSIVGWLMLGGDRYIQACARAIVEQQLIPVGEGRNLWFELDRVTSAVVATGSAASGRMKQAWTEPWPEHLVMVHFAGGHQTLGLLTRNVGLGGWEDMAGVWTGKPDKWPPT
jgi:hypothetical protein